MDDLKVIVAGSRGFNDYGLLIEKLDILFTNVIWETIEIVSGTARGADELGEKYATDHGLKIKQFPADWNKYGRSAGYKRNKEMAEYADAAVIFWDGKSKGAKHMIDLAGDEGLKVRVIRYNEI